jgi:drug/metabolite transporter (DMT)-like permease
MNDSKTQHSLSVAGFLITLTGAILFSTKAILVKLSFKDTRVDALTLLALRMIFSMPFYIVAAAISSKKKYSTRMTKRQWLYVILLGTFGYYLSSYFDFIGLQYVSAGLERLILFLYPSFAVLINAFLFGQKINRIQKIALVLTYVGIGIAYFGELRIDTRTPDFYWGSFLIFLCAITYSFYLAGSGRMIPLIGATKFTAYAMLASTFGVLIQFSIRGHFNDHILSSTLIHYSILIALLATVIPSFMLSYGIKQIGSNNVSIITSIGPVSTILQAHFILGDKIFAEQAAGTLLVILGVLMIGWQSTQGREI